MNKRKICSILAVSVMTAAAAGPVMAASQVQADKVSKTDKAVQTEKQVNFTGIMTQKDVPPSIASQKAEVAGEQDIDLRRAVVTAIRNNRDIRISELTLQQAQHAVSEAAASKNPSLSYSFDAEKYKKQSTTAYVNNGSSVVPVTVSNDHGYANGLSVTWPLYTGGSAEGSIQAARYSAASAQEDVYLTEADIKLSATQGYYQLLEAIRLQAVDQESVSNLSEHLTNVEQQYQAGIVTRLDVLSSRVSLANARQSYIAAVNSRELAEANLNNIMRIPMSTKLVPADKDFPQPAFDLTMEQAIALSMQNRWELKQADYNAQIARQQLRVARAGNLPTVAVTGGYNWKDTDFPGFKNEDWTVTGSVSWALFDGGATNSKIKEAKDAVAIADETALQTRESIQLEVREDYLNIGSAREKVNTTQTSVAEAQEAYQIAVVRYKAGVGTNLDVLDAQLNLNTAQTNYITALYDYNIGLATLEKAMGVPAVIRS